MSDIWINGECFAERNARPDLGGESFADDYFPAGASERRGEIFVFIRAAGVHIKRGVLAIDYVEARAATEYTSQIEILKLIVFEISHRECEHAAADVEIAADAALNIVRGDLFRAGGGIIGVDRGGVDGNFIARRNARSLAGESVIESIGIAAREAESGVDNAAPKIGEARMEDCFFVDGFFSVIADGGDITQRSGDIARGFRGDGEMGV